MVVCADGPILDPTFDVQPIGLEEIVLAYMGQQAPEALRSLHAIGAES
jgi:hypothetical protein